MKRREFLRGVGGGLLSLPLVVPDSTLDTARTSPKRALDLGYGVDMADVKQYGNWIEVRDAIPRHPQGEPLYEAAADIIVENCAETVSELIRPRLIVKRFPHPDDPLMHYTTIGWKVML